MGTSEEHCTYLPFSSNTEDMEGEEQEEDLCQPLEVSNVFSTLRKKNSLYEKYVLFISDSGNIGTLKIIMVSK